MRNGGIQGKGVSETKLWAWGNKINNILSQGLGIYLSTLYMYTVLSGIIDVLEIIMTRETDVLYYIPKLCPLPWRRYLHGRIQAFVSISTSSCSPHKLEHQVFISGLGSIFHAPGSN